MAERTRVLVTYASKMAQRRRSPRPSGDFRDWDRIRAWAVDIAHQLNPATAETQQ